MEYSMSELYKICRKRNGSIRYNEWRKERKIGIMESIIKSR